MHIHMLASCPHYVERLRKYGSAFAFLFSVQYIYSQLNLFTVLILSNGCSQLGPGQEMVVRWASSHNNTFMFTIVSGQDQQIFWDPKYYEYVWDYIKLAPADANTAKAKPRSNI